MKKLIALILSIVLIICAVPAVSAQTAVADEPIRILAIGNSYSNNATQYIDRIAEDLGLNVEAYSLYYPGCTIKQHVNFYNNEKTEYALVTDGETLNWSINTMQKAFALYDYDYVTIQQSPSGSDVFSTYWTESEPYLTQLYDIIKENEPQAEVLIHQTWSFCHDCAIGNDPYWPTNYNNTKEMFAVIEDCYNRAADKIGVAREDIIPVGKAIQLAKDEFGYGDFYNAAGEDSLANGALYTDNVDHLNYRGRYIASCVWLENIFGVDCRESDYVPDVLTAEECEILREIAHEAATGEQTTVDGDWRFIPNGDGVKVMHYNGTLAAHGTVAIPATLGGKTVNAVGKDVFKYVNGIKQIYIPEGELEIEDGAFDIVAVNKILVNKMTFDKEITSGSYFVNWWNVYQSNRQDKNFLIDPASGRENTTMLVEGKYGFASVDHSGNGGKSVYIQKSYSASSALVSHVLIKVARLFGEDKPYFTEEDLGKTFNISFWVYLEQSDRDSGNSDNFKYGMTSIASTTAADTAGYAFYGDTYTKKVNVGEWTQLEFNVTLDEKHIGNDQIGLLGIYLDDRWNATADTTPSKFYLDDIKVYEVYEGNIPVIKGEFVEPTGYKVTYMQGENVYAEVKDIPEDSDYVIDRVATNTKEQYFAGWFLDEALTNAAPSTIKVTGDTKLYAKMLPYAENLTIEAEANPTSSTYFTGFGAVKHIMKSNQYSEYRGLLGAYGVNDGRYGDLIGEGNAHRHAGYNMAGTTKINGYEVRDMRAGAAWEWIFHGDYILRNENGEAFIVKPDTEYKVTLTYTNEKTSAASDTANAYVFLGTGLSSTNLMFSEDIKLYDVSSEAYDTTAGFDSVGFVDGSQTSLQFNTETDKVALDVTAEDTTVTLTIKIPSLETFTSNGLLPVLSLSDTTNRGFNVTWKKIEVEEIKPEPIRILAIGNSFSNNSTQYIDAIANSLGIEVEAYSLYYPGCTIKQHVNFYNKEESVYALTTEGEKLNWSINTMQKAFNLYDYDYVTIQQSPSGSDVFSTYWTESQPYLNQLYDIIKENEPQAEILIHQTWSFCHDCAIGNDPYWPTNYKNTKEMFAVIEENYEKAADKIGLSYDKIMPIGKAIQLAKDEFGYGDFYNAAGEDSLANGALYTDNVDHLNYRGRYIASCVWVEFILGIDCRTSDYVPDVLTEEECVILREIAHEAATGEQDTVKDGWRVVENGDGVKITHYNGEVAENGVVAVPETIDGKAVNAIDHTIFKYVDGLAKIVLPVTAENNWDIDEGSFPVEAVYGEEAVYEQGDINGDGDVNAADLALLKKVIAGLTPIDNEEVKNPDVDGEGDIPNAADLAQLKKMIAGLV